MFKWIPEAPEHPGIYANLNGNDLTPPGKLQLPDLQPSTMNIHHSRQFDSKEECQKWCNENPFPKFVPMEHGFLDLGK